MFLARPGAIFVSHFEALADLLQFFFNLSIYTTNFTKISTDVSATAILGALFQILFSYFFDETGKFCKKIEDRVKKKNIYKVGFFIFGCHANLETTRILSNMKL